MCHHHEIHQRDLDGMFDVVSGGSDIIAGPFPSIKFAQQIASAAKPAPIDNVGGTFRRFGIVREVLRHAP